MTPMSVVDIDTLKITTQYCITDEQRDKNMSYAIKHIKNRLTPGPDRGDESIAVVCFGPSLRDNIENIRKFKYIITCSGAHKFLLEHGIVPTWHVDVDPRKHKIDLLGKPHEKVEYLLASAVHHDYVDLIKDYNVKLWHGFSGNNINELPMTFPRGEWVFAGGCTAGLRTLLLARFLGFKNIELFGMDCSYPADNIGEHAAQHPNPSKAENLVTTTYKNITYKTTLAMVEYAKQFFKEISLLVDVKIAMHGNGLLQHMAYTGWKDPEGTPAYTEGILAFLAPDVISSEYTALNKLLHETNPHYGISGSKYKEEVLKLARQLDTTDILDYGCGKGTLAKVLPFSIKEYDPAISGKTSTPGPTDLVICTDVLEHIEPEYLDSVLGDIARCTTKLAYFVIHNGPAMKTLPDGRNTHLIQENKVWWYKKLTNFFEIDEIIETGSQIQCWAAPKHAAKTIEDLDKDTLSFTFTEVEGVKFVTVNDRTEWRVSTLRTKEPITIEWMESFEKDEVFVDVGANMGIYALWAAKNREVLTYAFEPESQNYALLTQNIFINQLASTVKAYNLSIGDRVGMGTLKLTEFIPGSSCHQFDSDLNFNGKPGNFVFEQASFSVTLDYLVENQMIPQPTHIKIDVDGLEPKVIFGAFKTLAKVKSLLIEVNDHLEEHVQMIKILNALGFYYDQNQVNKSLRKSGAFEGIGEYVFKRQ